MKKLFLAILISSISFASANFAETSGERFQQSEESVKSATYGHIDAKGLKALIDSQTPLVILDGRGDNWHDGNVIPGAKLAFYTDSEEQINALVPDQDTLVVVYCYSFTCPLSPRLANRLVEFGYKNVIEYPAGLNEWRDIANYPIEEIERVE